MEGSGEAARVRIYIGENDVVVDRPLSDVLVYKAQELHLAGATAMRGRIGYGMKTHPSPSHLVLSHDRPLVIEIVDTRDKIDAYLAAIGPIVPGRLITIETVEVLRHGSESQGRGP
jgi:PII-like signaling protein